MSRSRDRISEALPRSRSRCTRVGAAAGARQTPVPHGYHKQCKVSVHLVLWTVLSASGLSLEARQCIASSRVDIASLQTTFTHHMKKAKRPRTASPSSLLEEA